MILLIYEERRIHLEGPERWISVQNKAVEPYDFDAALYNDTFPWEGAVEAGGIPMWHEPGAAAGHYFKSH